MSKLQKGSIIQANEHARDCCGCVLIVDKVEDWGVQAFILVPGRKIAYVRLNHDQYYPLRVRAPILPKEVYIS